MRRKQGTQLGLFYEGKLALVTGGTGFVGTHIVSALLDQGARVRIPVHRRAPLIQNERIETISVDLTQRSDCEAVMEGVDCVFHAAGTVGSAGTGPVGIMAGITDNLTLTAHVLEAAWVAGVERILLFSSSTGYPESDQPVGEDEMWKGPPHASYFGYGWMRRYIERMAEFAAQNSDLQIAIVRPTAVYGRHDNFDPATGHVIPALIRRAAAAENPFEVWGTGEEIRDFLNVTDLARGCLLMLEKHAVCDPVNIGSGQGVTIRHLVETILEVAGHGDAEIRFDASRPMTIPVRLVDSSKATSLIGFSPLISLRDGLSDTLAWFMSTQNVLR